MRVFLYFHGAVADVAARVCVCVCVCRAKEMLRASDYTWRIIRMLQIEKDYRARGWGNAFSVSVASHSDLADYLPPDPVCVTNESALEVSVVAARTHVSPRYVPLRFLCGLDCDYCTVLLYLSQGQDMFEVVTNPMKCLQLSREALDTYCSFSTTQERAFQLYKAGYGAGQRIVCQRAAQKLPGGGVSTVYIFRFHCHASRKNNLWRASLALTKDRILQCPTSTCTCPNGIGCSHGYLLGLFLFLMQVYDENFAVVVSRFLRQLTWCSMVVYGLPVCACVRGYAASVSTGPATARTSAMLVISAIGRDTRISWCGSTASLAIPQGGAVIHIRRTTMLSQK